ncbi:MAG: hypothetical protein QXT64_06555 [Desulfurococcaceae archaeon]
MKRSRATPALYLVTVLVIFMLLAAGISFTYFYMLSTSSTKPMLYAEVNVGSEQAGVRVGYYRSLPVWIILRARLPEGVTTIGPTILDVMVESTILTTVKCPERKVTSQFIALCSVTIQLSMLPQGEHIIYVVVRQTKLGDLYIGGFPVMEIRYITFNGLVYFRSIRSYPVDLSKSFLTFTMTPMSG